MGTEIVQDEPTSQEQIDLANQIRDLQAQLDDAFDEGEPEVMIGDLKAQIEELQKNLSSSINASSLIGKSGSSSPNINLSWAIISSIVAPSANIS